MTFFIKLSDVPDNHGSLWTRVYEKSNFINQGMLIVPMKLTDLCKITEVDRQNSDRIKLRRMQGTFNPSKYIEPCFYDLIKDPICVRGTMLTNWPWRGSPVLIYQSQSFKNTYTI